MSLPSPPLDFPHILKGEKTQASLDSTLEWIRHARNDLTTKLGRMGAILFRGYPIHSPQDFDRFIQAFDFEVFTYEESFSNAVRTSVTPRVFTANEAPPTVDIYLHHEMAQTPLFPEKLFFYCEIAPKGGGATPLCRSDVVVHHLEKAEPDLVAALEERGVRYSHTMPKTPDFSSGQGRSWQDTLHVETREEAETRLRALSYTWEWRDDESLRVTTKTLPAIRKLQGGTRVFFNQLIAAFRGWKHEHDDPRRSICYGDSTPIPADAMQTAISIADDVTYDLQWQVGDIALVDNYLVMHGRRSYTGQRRVLASLAGCRTS